jgi:prolyl-tRNA synthetase
MKAVRVEVVQLQLGTRYSDSLNCTFLDKDGKAQPVVMGSYGIGIGRYWLVSLKSIMTTRLMWPISIAPYAVLVLPDASTNQLAEQLHADLPKLERSAV